MLVTEQKYIHAMLQLIKKCYITFCFDLLSSYICLRETNLPVTFCEHLDVLHFPHALPAGLQLCNYCIIHKIHIYCMF